MFDYINTKYEDAEIVIYDSKTANKAINLIKDKIKETGKSAELLCYLSKACIFTNKHKLALKHAKEACKLEPDYNYAKARIIFAHYKLKNHKKVLSLIDELLKIKNLDTFSAHISQMAIDDLNDERINKLAEIINRDETLNNNKYDYTIKIITSCLNKEFEKAEKYIKEANEKQFIDSRICSYISYSYFHNKDYNNSLKYAEKGIELNHSSNYCYYRKGVALWKLYNKEETLKSLFKAEELGCNYDDMFQIIADIYLSQGEEKDSIKYINKAIKSAPDNAFNYNAKGIILSAFDNEKEAVKYFNKAVKLDNKAYYMYKKGCSLYWLNEHEKALKELKKAESSGYSNSDIFSKLSYLYCTRNDYKTSLEYANKAILLNNKDFYAHYRKGYVFMKLEKSEEAEISFLKAEELGCNYEDMYVGISISKYIKNDFENALKYINKAILKNDKVSENYYLKAQILSNLGKELESQKYYRKALKMGYKD